MNEQDELNYDLGSRAAWRVMLGECCRQLGYDDADVQKVAWINEREDAIAALRSACEDHGDNDWPDNLVLADVVEKHLVRYLNDQQESNTMPTTS